MWKTYHYGRGGGEWVHIERSATTQNANDRGKVGGRREIL